MKRFAFAIPAVALLTLGAGTALAAAPDIEEISTGFSMSSVTCSELPPGTTIEGTGTGTSVTSESTDRNGVTTVMNTTHIEGTATDQAGNTYTFNYANHYRISNTGPTDPVLSGVMVDSFSLAGNGPAHLNNGFRAVFTIDASTGSVGFDELSSRGDPLDFDTGTARCDPL
jgi:hypothetical protein